MVQQLSVTLSGKPVLVTFLMRLWKGGLSSIITVNMTSVYHESIPQTIILSLKQFFVTQVNCKCTERSRQYNGKYSYRQHHISASKSPT